MKFLREDSLKETNERRVANCWKHIFHLGSTLANIALHKKKLSLGIIKRKITRINYGYVFRVRVVSRNVLVINMTITRH